MQVTKQIGFYTVELEITIISNDEGYYIDEDFKIIKTFDNLAECEINSSIGHCARWLTEHIIDDQQGLFEDEFKKQAEDDKAEYGSYLDAKRKDQMVDKAANEEDSH